MIIGISMGQEICLIIGQVSLSLLCWKMNLPTEKCGPGGRLTRKKLASRPDYLWPEPWKSMGKHAKLEEIGKWSSEKTKLDNARRLRGINFIDPEDKEFKEIIKNACKKLETQVAPAVLCKITKKNRNWVTRGKIQWDQNQNLRVFLEASESSRPRVGESPPNWHENHITRKPWTFQQQRQQCMRNGRNAKDSGVGLDESQKFKRGDRWSKDVGRYSSFCIINGRVIWKMLNWRQNTKNTKVELYSEVIL